MAGLGYGCRGGEESDQVLSDTGLTVGELWLLAVTVLQLGISIPSCSLAMAHPIPGSLPCVVVLLLRRTTKKS